jgi:hypothetical protein
MRCWRSHHLSEVIKATQSAGVPIEWYAGARVLLLCPDNVGIEVERFHDPLLVYEDQDLARMFGLFVAEIAVDNWLGTISHQGRAGYGSRTD